jgi:hypothetical protein
VKSILGFLANLLLFLSISTLLFSIAAYFAFKLKAKRKPKSQAAQALKTTSMVEPELLQQYVQPDVANLKVAKPKNTKLQERSKLPRA